MTPGTLVVRGIGELATCDPRHGDPPGVIRDAAVVARDGIITYAGPEAGLRSADVDADAAELHAGGDAVIPGFVDAHTHAIWIGDRGGEYALRATGVSHEEVAALGGGIRATVRSTQAATVEELVVAARPRLRRMLARGTTTVEVKSGYGLELDAELRQLEAVRRLGTHGDVPATVATFLPLHGSPDGDREDFLDEVCAVWLPKTPRHVRFVDAYCDAGAFSAEECARVFEIASAYGVRPRLHADQHARSGGTLLAARIGAVCADHLEHADDEDLRALAAAAVVGVLLPGAALTEGGPPPPGRRLREAGARIAVATDCNPGTCYSESMPLMVSLAVSLGGLTPGEALVAATAGGATALELGDRGVIGPGLRCDLAVLDSPNWIDVAYHLGAAVVRAVVRDGSVLDLMEK